MKKIITISLVVLALVAIAVLPSMASVENDMKAAVGTPNSNAKFDVKVNAPATYKAGSSISVVVTIDNVTASPGLSLVEFDFNYDSSKLTLTNPNNDPDGALTCITKKPDDSFENLSAYKGNGRITASLCTMNSSPVAKNNGDITFTFNFNVNSDAEGDLGFYVKHSSVYGATMLDDFPYSEEYEGNGSYDICTKFVEEASKPATSNPTTSNPTTSNPTTSNPATSAPVESDSEVEGEDDSDVSDQSSVVSDEEGDESATVSDVSDEIVNGGSDSDKTDGNDNSSKAVSDKPASDEDDKSSSPGNIVPLIIAIIAVVAAATVIVIILVRRKNVR